MSPLDWNIKELQHARLKTVPCGRCCNRNRHKVCGGGQRGKNEVVVLGKAFMMETKKGDFIYIPLLCIEERLQGLGRDEEKVGLS